MQVARLCLFNHKGGRTVRTYLALMENDEVVARCDFIEQVRCPQHTNAFFGHKAAHVLQDIGASLDIEADCRLVEQEQTGPMEQCAGNFKTTHLSA